MRSGTQRISVYLAVLAFIPVPNVSATPPPVEPESVIVVANKAVPGSVKVARQYAQLRDIPKSNLVFINAGEQERISREAYTRTIHNPILEQMIKRGLVNAIKGEQDAFGRTTVMLVANPIRYMVLCYGVPVAVNNTADPGLDDKELRTSGFRGRMAALGRSFDEGPLAKNEASVDGELALLLQRDVPLNGFIPNPFFRNSTPEKVEDYIKVMRLDGPSVESVLKLMENTVAGEQYGLRGRAYVDLDGRSGAYQMGNDWMSRAATVFEEKGFSTTRHPERPTIPKDSRFDAPVLYAGWYAGKVQGPFTLPGFTFAPGAVAAHLHSSSARPLRSSEKGWVGPLIDKGACATFGNVAEPYLPYTHHFDLYFMALAEGWNVADAAYAALPSLSWQAVSIGDPFYHPFGVPLEEQLELLETMEDKHLNSYVMIRKINLLVRDGQESTAMKLAARGMEQCPGPALALRQAELLEQSGKKRKARQVLGQLTGIQPSNPNEWGLFAEIADQLLRLKNSSAALQIYKSLESVDMPEQVRLAFLKRGIQSARKAGDKETAKAWDLLVNPPIETTGKSSTQEMTGK